MAFDAHKNFALSNVATAPSPASSGTSLVVTTGQGALFPAVPFNVVICPAGTQPTNANAEIARVTNIAGDTLTISRAQEGSSARSMVVGDQIYNAATVKVLTDIEALLPAVNICTAVTSTGTVNDLAPTGLKSGVLNVIPLNNASDLTLTGLSSSGMAAGTRARFVSTGAGNVYLKHGNGGSSAADRFANTATSGDTPLAAGTGRGEYEFDGTDWVLHWHEQGAWIDYSGTSTFSGWSAFTEKVLKYRLSGRTCLIRYAVFGTSNATSASFTIPFVATNDTDAQYHPTGYAMDNGTEQGACRADIVINSATMAFTGVAGAGFTASGTKRVAGGTSIEVQ